MKRWILASFLACLVFFTTTGQAQVPDQIASRPSSAGPTPVKVGLYYIDISEIDGAKETFTVTAYLDVEWTDPRLSFTPKGEGNIRLYKPTDIWTPGIEIINAEKLEDQQPLLCTVTSDGTVYSSRRVVALLNNQMDLRRFPFDRQQMKFIVESSRYGTNDLVLVPDPNQSGLGEDIVSRGWNYHPLSWKVAVEPFAHTGEAYSRLTFNFEAERNPYYFIWKIIFPTIIFVFLTWSVFWLQVHDVQITLLVSITVLLTAVAFGNVADPLLPKLGYRTWLDNFQLGSFLFMVATVVETIAVYALNLGGETVRAEKARKLLRILYPVAYRIFCLILFMTILI